jgi:CubicO group peptidase (beta-lactamase class C family)
MDVQGFADARFAPVRECFAGILARQSGTGAAFAAWCDGRPVVDPWGGYADRERSRAWQADSLVQPYSESKPFAAVCALRLVQACRLDLDAAEGRPDLYRRAIGNPPGAQDPGVVNGTSWRAAEVPAVNGHGTARAVAGFYHALAAGRVLSPDILAEAVTPHSSGTDRVFGHDNSWGLGFGIGDDGYGMGGLGGNHGGTSIAGGYSIGFVTGSVGGIDRVDALEASVRECLGLPTRQLTRAVICAQVSGRSAPEIGKNSKRVGLIRSVAAR